MVSSLWHYGNPSLRLSLQTRLNNYRFALNNGPFEPRQTAESNPNQRRRLPASVGSSGPEASRRALGTKGEPGRKRARTQRRERRRKKKQVATVFSSCPEPGLGFSLPLPCEDHLSPTARLSGFSQPEDRDRQGGKGRRGEQSEIRDIFPVMSLTV